MNHDGRSGAYNQVQRSDVSSRVGARSTTYKQVQRSDVSSRVGARSGDTNNI